MHSICCLHLRILVLKLLVRECTPCRAVQSSQYLKPILLHARQCPEQDRPAVARRAQQQGHAARLQPPADSLEDLPPMPLPVQQMQQPPCPLHQALQPGLTGVTAYQLAPAALLVQCTLAAGTWQEPAAD